MNNKYTIVITKHPFKTYFQWFLLGFYLLEEQKIIKLKFRTNDISSFISRHTNNKYINAFGNKLQKQYNSYNLEGYIVNNKKNKVFFCIDCADSPFIFDSTLLNKVDCYFKMQCPQNISEDGFRLTENIRIPYFDTKFEKTNSINQRKRCKNLFINKNKVFPLMVGPRCLSRFNSFKELSKSYAKCQETVQNISNRKKIMCYFGDSMGPMPDFKIENPDFNNEQHLMGFFKDQLNHPNEKRAKAANIISSLGKDISDARVINSGNSDNTGVKQVNSDLIIPLKDFCHHISGFDYNLNISGYRRSIPNRFIESFMVGTAIFTDKLAVKWYLPFEDEVRETVEMGYLLNQDVDWIKFENDLKELPPVNKKNILENFNKKWAPEKVAKYILDTLITKLNE